MRIVSLLPSATEICFALGLGDSLAGVTHECDYPPEAATRRVVVRSRAEHSDDPAEIDRRVREFIARGESIYAVDAEALRELRPDLILTQDLCHVCAASPDDLATALSRMPFAPQVISLEPRTLAEVWENIRTVGRATGREAQADAVLAGCMQRIEAVRAQAARAARRPRVVCLEWLDPPFAGGHWVPEMVSLAGGEDVLGHAGKPSFTVTWEQVRDTCPEAVALMPCGYTLEQVVQQAERCQIAERLRALLGAGVRVFPVDATSYFSRPGPRLATGVEILFAHLHGSAASAMP